MNKHHFFQRIRRIKLARVARAARTAQWSIRAVKVSIGARVETVNDTVVGVGRFTRRLHRALRISELKNKDWMVILDRIHSYGVEVGSRVGCLKRLSASSTPHPSIHSALTAFNHLNHPSCTQLFLYSYGIGRL
jgi:hypothetical protein